MAEETGTPTPAPTLPIAGYEHAENFFSAYSNNAQFESNPWDLRIIFGEQVQREGKIVIEQHTAIRLSWVQAKLVAHFIRLHVALNEFENGKIKVPNSIIPPVATLPEEFATNPQAVQAIQLTNKLRDEFVASLSS